MSISSELCAEIREFCERDRPPAKWHGLSHGFRLAVSDTSADVVLYRTDEINNSVIVGRSGRDAWHHRWFLNPGWREQVSLLVCADPDTGVEAQDVIEEEILW